MFFMFPFPRAHDPDTTKSRDNYPGPQNKQFWMDGNGERNISAK